MNEKRQLHLHLEGESSFQLWKATEENKNNYGHDSAMPNIVSEAE